MGRDWESGPQPLLLLQAGNFLAQVKLTISHNRFQYLNASQDFLNFSAHGIADFMLDIRLLNLKLCILELLNVFFVLGPNSDDKHQHYERR